MLKDLKPEEWFRHSGLMVQLIVVVIILSIWVSLLFIGSIVFNDDDLALNLFISYAFIIGSPAYYLQVKSRRMIREVTEYYGERELLFFVIMMMIVYPTYVIFNLTTIFFIVAAITFIAFILNIITDVRIIFRQFE